MEIAADQDKKIKKKQDDLKSLLIKIDNIEEKFFNNDIDNVTYKKWHHQTHGEKAILQADLACLKYPLVETRKFYSENLSKLGDLHYIYQKGKYIINNLSSVRCSTTPCHMGMEFIEHPIYFQYLNLDNDTQRKKATHS